MNWQIYSVLATISSAFFVLFQKISSNIYLTPSILSIFYLFSFLFFYIVKPFLSKKKFKISDLNIFKYIEIYSIVAGISFGLAGFFITNALKYINNPGIPSALVRGGVIFTYIISFLLFNEKFNIYKFFGILVVILSIFVEIVPDLKKSKSKSNLWILFTLLASISAAILNTTSKLSMKKLDDTQLNIIMLLLAYITNVIIQFFQDKSFGLKKLDKPRKENLNKIEILNQKPIISIIGGIITLIIFKYFFTKAIKISSNPNNPRMIFNNQYILLLILSLFVLNDSNIKPKDILACILMFIGALIFSFF